MLLTQAEFDTRKAGGQLKIALIGMSNIGKSHWTRQIETVHGFTSYEVDAAIQAYLSLETITQSAHWMGHPYETGYAEKSAQYMQLETDFTLAKPSGDGNHVLDTTGSVVHLSECNKTAIHNNYLVVYLKADAAAVDTLVVRFHQTPKPLIWGAFYEQKSGLPAHESMLACYPELLKSRADLYEKMSDITLSVTDLKNTHTTDFLTALRNALPNFIS